MRGALQYLVAKKNKTWLHPYRCVLVLDPSLFAVIFLIVAVTHIIACVLFLACKNVAIFITFFLECSNPTVMFDLLIIVIYLSTIPITLFFFSRIDNGERIQNVALLDRYPKVSIIIPTRNEVHNIRACLQSIFALDYPDFEVIVVDGNSTDGTKSIIENEFPQAKLIEEPPRPRNWIGKPWACHVGSQRATGDILLFTDADTIHKKESLRLLVSVLLTRTNGFLTIVTRLRLQKFWEYTLIIIFQSIALSMYGARGSGSRHLANGQYLMFTRKAYEEIGGHEAVFDKIVEDMELASIATEKGRTPVLFYIPHLVSVRMYHSFHELFSGFGKNLAIGASTLSFGSTVRVVVLHIWATGWLFLPILNHPLAIPASIFGYVSYAAVCFYGQGQLTGKYSPHMLFAPLYFLIYLAIIYYSFYQVFLRRKVQWKGISYPI